jgi:hypothetical protein
LRQRIKTRRFGVLAAAAAVAAVGATAAFADAISSPSSSQSPYVLRSESGVVTKSILTVGDSVNNKPDGTPYRMVGIPDGLGAFDNGNGTFTLLMNHELPGTSGIVRSHGSAGSFVSKWTIRKDTLQVLHGEDLIKNVVLDGTTLPISRLCSADLAPINTYYDAASGKGYSGRLFMNGEESGQEGRAFAHAMDGTSWELPALGKYNWENSLTRPDSGDNTIHIGIADETPGQVYFYLGHKQTTGNAVEKAGLTNGDLYGIKVTGFPLEPAGGIPSGTSFTLANLGSQNGKTGLQLETQSDAGGVTEFLRPEDGAWDPTNPNHFYFVTTNAFTAPSRLWRLNFVDPSNPAAGGTIDMVLDGTEGQRLMDNITVNDRGQILAQEDIGNQTPLGKVWQYFPGTDKLKEIAHHDPERFMPGGSKFLTQDEESSGIVPAPFLGAGWYLLDVQAHYTIPGELVEGGQLLAMHVPPGKK